MEPENFSEPEAQAAPAPPSVSEAVAMSAEELAANPEEARRRFAAAVVGLREAFAAWVAVKEEQFEQVLEFGWSGQSGDAADFLERLEEEHNRLSIDAAQADRDIEDMPAIIEQESEYFDNMERMKVIWAELCAEGVPRDQWPLGDRLVLEEQLQEQAEVEREVGKRKP